VTSAEAPASIVLIDRLIMRYGLDAKLFEWEPEADCPRKLARNEHDPHGARCPDLAKVV
jgi:hypothetical protein